METTKPVIDPRLGRIPVEQLGPIMHRVDRPKPCPICLTESTRLGMDVFPAAVRWPCGHTRTIPKINPACYAGCYHNRARTLLRRAA